MEELNILYACDDKYAPFCGVSMLSLLSNNIDVEKICIYVVVDKVSKQNQDKLKRTANHYSRDLILIDAEEVKLLMEKIGVPKYRGSYATHYRKFFQMFIPNEVHKILYLDADTIVCDSLKQLLHFDMQGKCMGVVLDTLGGRYKKLLGFRYGEPYFNAGVTWIDVDLWKERNYSKRMMDHIEKVRARYCNPDQDLFNLVLRGDIYVIPLSYNFQPAHRAYTDNNYFANYPDDYYSVEEIQNARYKPIVLHTYRFLGEFPWHKNNMHPDTKLFDAWLLKSEWKDFKKMDSNAGMIFKIEKIMYKFLPKEVFLRIFQKAMYFSFYKRNKKLSKHEN